MAAHPVPELVDDAMEEILLRCLPDDPARLHRAALVCKRWRRLVSAAAFRRRYAERHRAAQPLGFVCNFTYSFPWDGGDYTAHFVPTFSSPGGGAAAKRKMRALDVRHGRVLLQDMDPQMISLDKVRLIIWNPITGDHQKLPRLSVVVYSSFWSAAVLCANGDSGCDHLSCHNGHFKVVVVGFHPNYYYAYSCVYSSEPGRVWSVRPVSAMEQQPGCRFNPNQSALVGNALHFVFQTRHSFNNILKYDLATKQISTVDLPPAGSQCPHIVLLTTEDGGLGLAIVGQSKLDMWSMVDGMDGGADQWYQSGVIDLEKLIPAIDLLDSTPAVGFAGEGIIFLGTEVGNFVVDLKSNQVRKLSESTNFYSVFPFSSFCIPEPRGP